METLLVARGAPGPGSEIVRAIARIGTVHYARWVIVLGPGDGFRPLLTLGSDFDGPPADAHRKDLVTHLGPLLVDIYAHCEGCDPAARRLAHFRNWSKSIRNFSNISRRISERSDWSTPQILARSGSS